MNLVGHVNASQKIDPFQPSLYPDKCFQYCPRFLFPRFRKLYPIQLPEIVPRKFYSSKLKLCIPKNNCILFIQHLSNFNCYVHSKYVLIHSLSNHSIFLHNRYYIIWCKPNSYWLWSAQAWLLPYSNFLLFQACSSKMKVGFI